MSKHLERTSSPAPRGSPFRTKTKKPSKKKSSGPSSPRTSGVWRGTCAASRRVAARPRRAASARRRARSPARSPRRSRPRSTRWRAAREHRRARSGTGRRRGRRGGGRGPRARNGSRRRAGWGRFRDARCTRTRRRTCWTTRRRAGKSSVHYFHEKAFINQRRGYYGGVARGASVAVVRVSAKSLTVKIRTRVRGAFDSPRCEPSRVRMIIRYWCLSSSALSWRVKSSFASVSSQSSSHCLTSSASSSSAPHSVGRRRSRVGSERGGAMRANPRDLGDELGRDLDARGNSRRTFVAKLLELVVALQVDGDVLRLLLLLLGHGGFASAVHTK